MELPVPAIALNRAGELVGANAAWSDLVGCPASETIGRPVHDFIDPEREATTRRFLGETAATGRGASRPFDVVRKDGGRVTMLCDAFVPEDGGAVVCLLRDASAHFAGDVSVRDSEELRKAYSDASFEAVLLSERGICIDINETARRMFGYTDDGIIGRPVAECVAPGSRNLVDTMVRDGVEEPYEVTALRRDGSTFPAEIQGRMVDYRGRRVRVAAVRDISTRKAAQMARDDSESRNRALIEAIPDLMLIMSADGVYLDYKAAADVNVYAPPELFLGRTLHDIMPAEVADLGMETIRRVLATGRSTKIEYSLPINGEEQFYEVRAAACGDDKILFVIRNMTETLRLREAETRSQRLETAGRIAGQVAHDFNNLLSPLMAYPEIIAESLGDGDEAHELLKSVQQAAKQMADINQQLLTLGRRGHYNQSPLDLNAIVANAVRGLPDYPDTVSVATDLADDLMFIKGGETQIYRAVSNLLHNALDSLDGLGTIRIETVNRYVDDTTLAYDRIPRGEYAVLTVSDTGGGIPHDHLDRIFDPFFTTKTASKERGSGLGLSVVDGVVRDHGGSIDIETGPGEGTVFRLLFPITREAPDNAPATEVTGRGEHVLVIDDDRVQREVNVRILERLGYTASAVASGQEALLFLDSSPCDLLVLDMVMPGGLDGAETYRRIAERVPGQKAVIVSGYSESQRVQEAQRLGAGAFVKKPLTIETLGAAVRRELDRDPIIQTN